MKKILYKLFPKFFTIVVEEVIEHKTVYLDPKELENQKFPFHLAIVAEDAEYFKDTLGLHPETVDRLNSLITNATQKESIADAVNIVSKNVKHINEFTWCIMQVYEIHKMKTMNNLMMRYGQRQ